MSKEQLYADQHIQVLQELGQVRDLLSEAAPMEIRPGYRIRLGAVEVTYSPESRAYYVYMPGHEQATLPVHTHVYCHDDHVMIHVDHDQHGRAYGIEILG